MPSRHGAGTGGKSTRKPNTQRDSSVSVNGLSPNTSNISSGTGDLCGTCGGTTNGDSIGCDKCPMGFHDSTICVGLSQTAIQALKDAGGVGILFVCTCCWVGRGGNSGGFAGAG